jgi:hypothetical protein
VSRTNPRQSGRPPRSPKRSPSDRQVATRPRQKQALRSTRVGALGVGAPALHLPRSTGGLLSATALTHSGRQMAGRAAGLALSPLVRHTPVRWKSRATEPPRANRGIRTTTTGAGGDQEPVHPDGRSTGSAGRRAAPQAPGAPTGIRILVKSPGWHPQHPATPHLSW